MELGQKVIVKAKMESQKKRFRDRGRQVFRKELEKPLKGVFVGVRVMKEGKTEIPFDEPPIFIQSGYKYVYLIAVNKAATVKALPEDVEALEGGGN